MVFCRTELISLLTFAEYKLPIVRFPNKLFPINQFPNIFCRIVLPNGSVSECLFCRMVVCRLTKLRNIVAEWPTLGRIGHPGILFFKEFLGSFFQSQFPTHFNLIILYGENTINPYKGTLDNAHHLKWISKWIGFKCESRENQISVENQPKLLVQISCTLSCAHEAPYSLKLQPGWFCPSFI